MTSEHAPAAWSGEGDRLRLSELLELVDCGALTPDEDTPGQWVFGLRSLTIARTARRLREDFELEPHGAVLLLVFAERIRRLEEELRDLRARLPR
jgi:chaperone modulatory protein CbpM